MKASLVALSLLCILAARDAGAQCCGDCSGNGTVSIDELIVAVNNNLNNCAGSGPTPTPTMLPDGVCPIDFADDNTQPGTPDCLYAGRWNSDCGDDQLLTTWRSGGLDAGGECDDPPCVVVIFFTEFDSLDCGGEIASPTEATLFGCFLGPNEEDFVEANGTITLGTQGGTIVMDPVDAEAPFTIGMPPCAVTLYEGTLTDIVTPSSAAAQRRSTGDVAARLQRLRGARKPTPPKPNFPRP